ncbi:microtubule-actin cross-linking factor 1 isoform X25 [Anguilla anguilla]|uniref:microtubule-actin cross-linking factor 1 isoform X25 n=1 Tax=Anguilla anguilla TaxID=7936 RepID=UPI0015AE6261|nr:microtubule-actin cross-linking factor 1 isoform X25 [Anguilla anguilla]
MSSSDEESLSERSCVSERSFRSERSGGSLSPCPAGPPAAPGDTLPWNLSRHERRKRKSQDSVLDPAERAVVRVADERDRVQKKTFTKWVNKHLIKVRKHITDLYEDLRDGHNLISLLEVLSGVALHKGVSSLRRVCVSRAPPLILLGGDEEDGAQGPREKGRMRFHRLQNVQIALDFLKQRQVKLVNIRNDDITDGNPKLTLGLIWTIILHFQISEIYVSGESGDLTAKEKLLLWSQQAIEGYPGTRCVNFSSSWSDGRMFNVLLHRYRPDLIDMEVVGRQSNRDNLEQAFDIAESLGVTRLLDAEDVDVPSPDEKSVITYVSSIYDAFPKIPEGGEGIPVHEVDQRWAEYQARFPALLQWTRQHTLLMADKNFPQNPVELKALYNEYVHFKETEIPAKEMEKSRIEHLYKMLEVWMEFGRIKLPQGLHPNDLEEEWGKLILEMLEREKALRPAVERLELLLQMANKIQNAALDCEEKLTHAKNTVQAGVLNPENVDSVRCEQELGVYLQDCEGLIRQLQLDLQILRDEKYYQVEQLAFRVSCLQEELVSLRLQCSSVYRKGHFSPGGLAGDQGGQRGPGREGLSLPLGAQTLLGAVGAVGALLRRPMSRSELVAMSSSEDEGSLRFIYELLGWVEETQDLLEQAEWGADLPSVEQHLQDHRSIHTAVEGLLQSLKEARSYESTISPNFHSSYSETLAKLEHQYCKLLEHSSWRLRCLESLHAFVSRCTEELIWLNEREEEELAFDWSENNTNIAAKRELYADMKSELEEKQEVMHSLQETADRLCQENHPAKQTVEAYSAALQTQWEWVSQLCLCVEQHLKDNTAYFQFVSDVRECESYLRQLQDTIKRQYTCDKNSRLGKLEDLLQDSMEEKEQLIEYRSTVASLVGRAKTVVQLGPRNADCIVATTTPIRAVCDYRQIEITIGKGEECVLEDNTQRTKWKVISPSGNEAMVPSVCFTVPPPNQGALDTASRMEQLYQNVMALWHQLHVNMKSVVSWHYLQKDTRTISSWTLEMVRSQAPLERQQALDNLEAHLTDFLADSRESALFTPAERRELEKDAEDCRTHCQALMVSMETVEKDESVSRSYLTELQDIKRHLVEAEHRLTRGIQTPLPSNLSSDGADNTVHIAEQEKLQRDLDGLRSSLGEVSRRCVSFFEEKPSSTSVPVLRSELNVAVEQMDRLHALSSVYLHKLKTVDVLMRSSQAAESLLHKYESRLSEEDMVPADSTAIQGLREQLGRWQSDLDAQEHVFQSLSTEVQRARAAGAQLSTLHPDRSPELDRYQEKAAQLTERWAGVRRQIETRRADLDTLGSVLQQYRQGHSALIRWIEETTERQENTQPGQTDSKVLSEQLAQQTALVAEIEQNQVKLDQCQAHSKQYCSAVKDYELQLMTYRAFVESTQKSPVKRRRMHSSSDAITQEFMDLRTRYTALVTLTTQHVKYISDALRRLEEEEKEVEEERQAHVGQVTDLLCWVRGLQDRTRGPTGTLAEDPKSAESSLAAQQAINEQLAAKKEEVAEAIRSTQAFLRSKQASKLSAQERARVASQLEELTDTYGQLCQSSSAQLQQLEQQLAREEERKSQAAIAGVIDLGTVETFPVFQAAQRGLIDQDTCYVLLEAQLTMGGLLFPDSPESFSLDEGISHGLIDSKTAKSLSELEAALRVVDQSHPIDGHLVPVAVAIEEGLIGEEVGLRILELQISAGGLQEPSCEERLSPESAMERGLLSPRVYSRLSSRSQRRELIDPNTAEKLSFVELLQRCVLNPESGLWLLPVSQQPGGAICLRSGRKVGIFRAVQEGLIDRQVTVRLLEAQLFAGGIADPRTGHRLTVEEAVRHSVMDQDLACALLTRQLQAGGLLDPVSGERLGVDEAIRRDLLAPRMALLVLESLWAFMGLLWPESGELLPIAEALQQGVISGDLARRILNRRRLIGALYLPETSRVVPLDQAEEVVDTRVVEILRQTEIPDVLPNMNQSGSPTLNRLSWGSASSSPPSSSPPTSPPGLNCDPAFMKGVSPGEQAEHRLLFHLMTRSYVDAHSGQRLVLLEPELAELANATSLVPEGTGPRGREALSEIDPAGASPFTRQHRDTDELGFELSWSDTEILEVQDESSKYSIFGKDITPSAQGNGDHGPVSKLDQQSWRKEKSPEHAAQNDQTKKETEQITDSFCGEHKDKAESVAVVPKTVERKRDNVPQIVKEGMTKQGVEIICDRMLPPGGELEAIPPAASEEKRLKLVDGQSGVGDEKTSIKQVSHEVLSESSAMDMPVIEIEEPKRAPAQVLGGAVQPPVGVRHAEKEALHKEWRDIKLEEAEPRLLDQRLAQLKQTGAPWADETITDKHASESTDVEMPLMIVEDDDQATMSPERVHIETSAVQGDTEQKSQTVQLVESGLLDRAELLRTAKQALKVRKQGDNEAEKKGVVLEPNGQVQRDSQRLVKEGHMQHVSSGLSFSQEGDSPEQREEDRELERLAKELQEGGLRTDGGERLLLDEAVSQGILPGHTAVKLMERAGLFGGFLDVSTCEALSVEDVVQEGLLDESLMQSVLQSEKTLAGVVDVEHGKLYSLQDAARVGLLDPETVARLLEAQVVSGGVVDLRRGKKVSVTLASNLGLIDEGQREELATLEKSCRGKSSDPGVVLSKATLQLQMDGMVDPKTRAPVTLMEALQKGLLDREEAQRVLSEQVAEGGIMHHGSGVRLSVADALQRGLVDEGMVQELEYLERAYHDPKLSSTDPSTAFLLASTGSIYDPESGCRLTLSKALSQGLLDKATAESAMASPGVVRGVLDPHSAHIVPYSELINQGKIDIETGQRFLEVHPFRGVRDQQTGRVMTVPQALEVLQVDKVPAMRLLQNQADTGGIVDVCTGDRLSLPEAVTQGQVGESMARLIATNQVQAGGLLDPASGERVPSLREATEAGLITRDMAAALQGNLDTLVEEEEEYDEESTDSEREMLTGSVNGASSSPQMLPSSESGNKSQKLSHIKGDREPLEKEVDSSLETLALFAAGAGKRLQQALEEMKPQLMKTVELQPSLDTKSPAHEAISIEAEEREDRNDTYRAHPAAAFLQTCKPDEVLDTGFQTPPKSEAMLLQSDSQRLEPNNSRDEEVILHEPERWSDEKVAPQIAYTENTRCQESWGSGENMDTITFPLEPKSGRGGAGSSMDAGIEMGRDKRDETGIALNSNESEKQMTGEDGEIGLKQRPSNDAILSSEHKHDKTQGKKREDDKDETTAITAVTPSSQKGGLSEGLSLSMEVLQQQDVREQAQPAVKKKSKSEVAESGKGVPIKTSEEKKPEVLDSPLAQDVSFVIKKKDYGSSQKDKAGKEVPEIKLDEAVREITGVGSPLVSDGQRDQKRTAAGTVSQQAQVKSKGEQTTPPQVGEQQQIEREEMDSAQKVAHGPGEKEVLLMKAKESILRKVFERGVSERQAAEELEALRKVPEGTECLLVPEEEHSGGNIIQKRSEVKMANESKPNDIKEKEPASLLSQDHISSSDLAQQIQGEVKGRTEQGQQGQPGTGKGELLPEQAENLDMHSRPERADLMEGLVARDRRDVGVIERSTFAQSPDGEVVTDQQKLTHAYIPAMPADIQRGTIENRLDICKTELQSKDVPHQQSTSAKQLVPQETSKYIPESHPLENLDDLPPISGEKGASNSSAPTFQAAETLLEKTMEELRLDIPLSDRTAATQEPQLQESPDSGESQSEETLESDVAESIEEGEEEEEETEGETKEPQAERKKSSRGSKSSLVRQECLEHDQQIMALTSMVRHIQVRLKQQQQQSIGRSLNALDDIIRQVEALDLELVDLEPEVKREVEAAAQLLEPCPEEVPPQLLKALEKDQRSLARGYAAAREVAQNALQGLRATRDSKKEAVSAELQSLGQRVEDLLSWLKETESATETQVDRVTGTDVQTQGQSVRDGTSAQLTQKLQLCKELQSSLSARSGDVGSVALDVQVFISERAQDLAPEQSRQLLGHLQQLQRAFHEAAGRTQARADGLAAQREREEERERREREKEQQEKEREKERENAREREVTQQQKAECSQKLEGLAMWLAGAASSLANQKAGAGSGDVGVLQQKQRELKEVQRDLQSRGDGVSETVRGVEEFLAEKGNGLSAEERASLQRALSQVREQYGSLTDTTQTSLAQLDTAISATVQQNTQRAKAVEELQETQGKIDTLLKDLSSLQQPGETPQGVMHTDSASSIQPGGAVHSHCDMLQAELQQLQAQQAQLMQVSQSAQSLLLQPDSSVPAEEKQRLRAALDRLRSQHQERLQSCQDRLRRADALRDELAKFLQEHAHLEAWLEQSEQELRSLGEGETDAQGLKRRLEEHKKLGEDVICHKADLRFVSISGQKALDWVQGAREREGGVDPALEETQQLVSDRLQNATQRYATLHTKSSELGTHLSGLLDRYQQYQDEAGSLTSWLTAQEQNQCVVGPSGEQTDTQTLQNTLRAVQLVQDELAERSVQLERVRRAGRDLANAQESPTLRASDISSTADALEGRFGALSASVSARAEQLQTAVAQSVSVQEGLQTLLSWLNGLVLAPGPVLPTAQAVQDALTQNQKLRQELLSRQGSVDTTRDSVSKLLQTADATTASGLQGALQDLSHRYTEAQAKQGEREAELRGLLPRLESYERLSTDLRNFTQSRERALSLGGQPDCSVKDYKQTIEEVKSELNQEEDQLKSLCELGTNLSQSRVFTNTQSLLDTVKEVSEEFARLQSSVNERSNAVQGCGEQLAQFRSLSGALLRWLQATQEQLPSEEAGLSTEALQRRVQQLQELLSDWQAQGARVQDLNQTGSELEAQIISITAPYSKTGVSQLNGASSPSSINGIHTCKDLTEIQVALADVNGGYERLGAELRERQGRQASSLELRQRARRDAEALAHWLGDREHTLALGQTASPSKPEAVRAQAQQNKALLSELAEHSGKVEELKSSLQQLIAENPDSPETETWKEQLRDIDSRWEKANQMAAQRQAELETCADRLGSFAAAASQLGPWLREKELMMSVLGPLSIDPNMLNTQKQQVQFMLREFETRRPQFEQLTQAAEGILSPGGEAQDQEEVRAELEAVSGQWGELTRRLSQRSELIERAQGTSERYQALLRELALSVGALAERLDAQASLSAQPEALRRRLQETGEIRAELEQRRGELGRAEQLCGELSAIVAEPYLRDELRKRLESVSAPLRSLEERAEDSMSQLQAALSSTQQFQQMFEELRGWLDEQGGLQRAGGAGDALPCEPGALRTLLERQEELQRGAAQQRGSYDLLQAEGVSLLASLPAGGEERAALQSRLAALRQDWEALNHSAAERHGRLREALSRAELYQQHRAELAPWVEACEGQEGEVQPSLEPAALEEALQKARQLGLDLERRRPLVEALNAAADTLLEQCRAGEEEVRDEKAGLNRRVDGLSERLQARAAQLEELAGRLREFEEGRQSVERRLESARHQIEVQEALGPQACSNKSLERLRGQQEALLSLQPQVAYLRGLAGGLVQDAPGGAAGDQGGQRLEQQARDMEREFGDVSEKIEQCCSSLESRLQGVGEVQARVRDVFSRLADLDDELDALSPVGRDADSLASQAEAVRGFLGQLAALRAELEAHGGDCTAMLRREGSSPDLLALRREAEALSRQAGKLAERGQARLAQIQAAADRVREFYARVAELQGLLGRAEDGLNAQGAVGTEVEVIKQQLREFKGLEREQVDCIQPKLQQVNAVGQGLIQSAAKHTDTQALEHDLETTNLRWNSLNKRVAERIAQLQEALLHCGKFQDALEPLLSWLSDTEELIANQKPPSAEYRVVKAQIQEQKLLQRLLDDRRGTVQMIRGEGERIAAAAEPQDRDKIRRQLESLGERWTELLDKASARQSQLEELQVLALQFHEAVEPLGEWLSATERRLSSAEPMGTQTAKITQQIARHKALQEEVSSRGAEVERLEALGQSLSPLSCAADRDWLGDRVGAVRGGHSELRDWCERRAAMLEQALANAQLFGEEEVEVLNWLAEVAQRLAEVSVQSYQPDQLTQQHKHTLSLNEEIVSRKKTVDQAIKNGQALLKQTTGEEVLLIQEKLDGIKSRYAEMTAGSSKALRTLEQALQLATRFATAHEDLNQWLDSVEAELNNGEPDTTPAYQDRQKELKCVSAEKRLVLDTVNEVGSALLDLVPWRAREGLDRLVADANQRYRQADETITQRVQLVQAAIQRSQQYEEAVDAELAWVGETERKLGSLGPLSLEPDVTVAQLQVQRAFNIDIIRHKDTVDQLLKTRDDILETCSDQQRESLKVKTDSLSARYEAVSQSHSERFSALEQAQVLVARFWETYEELEPWLGETEALITQLPPPAIDTEALRQQQDQMRLLRESIAEHKPHIDKLVKIGPQMAELSAQEGATVRQRYSEAEKRYLAIKEDVKGRASALDEAVSQSAQFHDKMDPLLETLEGAVQRLRQPPPVAAEVDKIREQLADHRATGLELDKLLPSFSALCTRGEELITRAPHDDPAAQAVRSRLLRLRSLWDEIRQRAEEREGKLQDVLDLAGKFWADMGALLSTLRDSQDIVKDLEDPGVDPSLIKQQIEAAEAIKAETDGLREELEFVRTLGADLIFACGETEKPEVKKTIDEMNAAWEGLNRTWRERMERLDEAMTASVQYQDALQGMFDYLDNAVIKLCDMSTVGTDLSTVKQQIEELKLFKVEVYQQQIDMEKLCHQGELLLKKVSDHTDQDMIQEPLTELRHLWDNLGEKITHRQHKLEGALLALGQFQHALSELQSWLSHTHTTLDTQRPISSDPKAIEIELAKHHVLRNDVLSHRSTVETVNGAGSELLESSPGDEASHLRVQLDELNRSWESLLLKTEERQKLLEAALQQAEGFHGELEEFLQWLRRTESQLSAAKPTGGLPETAREQLQQHTELQAQLAKRTEQYHRLLDQGETMLLSRGEEGGPGATQTQQNLALLQNKWASLNTKMDDRRAKLEEAVALATGFQSSLQDTINWLTQTEQALNMAQPPSLILDTVLFQIDEHKVFVNEVNTHREQVLALEKAGAQLRFASLKQDVVLIKNLLLSVQARWDKLVQRSLDRGRHLDEARKRAKQFHEAWRKLTDWLEEAESRLDSELEISNEPDKIKVQLAKHKEFQKALGSKQPVYDTTVRSGRAMRDKATLPADTQKLDNLLGEVRDKWDTVCGKSVERQHKLEEALLFSGQFAEALQALVDWLYRVEPQLCEDQPVHGDLDLVSNLMDSHKAFQKELGKRTGSVQALKRSARDLMETGRDDTAWVRVQLQELSNRWDTVCALSVTKQTRLQQALKQAEEFRAAVQMLLEWLSEAEQTLRFRGVLPEEVETLQALLHSHREFMQTVEEKRVDVNKAAGLGEAILAVCHPDCITTIKHWITIIRARFEEVLTWAKQHEQRLETALAELLNNAALLEELLSWLQWAETTLVQRDTEPLPQDIPQLKTLITEHQVFMEEMTRKQPDVDRVTKTYKRKPAEPPSSLAERRGPRKQQQQQQQAAMQVAGGNPRLNQLCSRWQQVWLLALDRQRKLNDALDRLEELKEFANFDFDVWRKKYMRWMNHKKSRVMDFFRRIDKDQDGKITRQEFIDGILASKFPTSRLEMTAVADIFDRDCDGYIDYYEFVAALHPNKDAYRPTTDADKIEDEVTRQVAQCKCAKRFQVEQIGENKYRFFLGNQFGDSQQLRLVRILRSTVMVRVGGGWMALDEFLVKNDPCRARGRTNLELREKFILPEGASQGLAAFRSRGRRSKPSSRTASPTRSSSSASHSAPSCASLPSAPATPTASSRSTHTQSRGYAKPWLAHSKTPTPTKCQSCPDHSQTPGPEGAASSKLKRPTFHSSRGSLTGENGGQATPSGAKPGRPESSAKRAPSSASGPASRAGSRAGSRASSRRGSDASDASELLETRSACSDTSDTPRRPGAKPSKIPTISKKAPSPKTPTGKR